MDQKTLSISSISAGIVYTPIYAEGGGEWWWWCGVGGEGRQKCPTHLTSVSNID